MAPDSGLGSAARSASSRPFARIRHVLLAVYLLLVAVLVVFMLRIVLTNRDNALDSATQQNRILARVLEEHLARTFGETDRALQELAAPFATKGGPARVSEYSAQRQLWRHPVRLPQLAFYGIQPLAGRMMARANEQPVQAVEPVGLESLAFFQAHADEAGHVGREIRNPLGAESVIPLSRRISLADGSFGGVAVAGIATSFLARFYEDMKLPPETTVVLLRPDGAPVFRHSLAGGRGSDSYAGSAAFRDGKPASSEGVFEDSRFLGEQAHLVAYHWLPDQSAGVLVGLPLDRVYEASLRFTVRAILSGLLIAAVFGAFFRVIFRRLQYEERIMARQRLTEERLRESETGLRAIFDNVQEGILVADAASKRLVMANPAICRMLGYSSGELQSMTAFDLHPPEARERVAEALQDMTGGKYGLVPDMPVQRKDGRVFYVDISPTGFSSDGKPSVLSVFRDVTEIRQARQALLASEARLREAQRMAHIGSWELDLASQAIHWSDEIYRIFEVEPKRQAASYDTFTAVIHPEDRERVAAARRESVSRRSAYEIVHRLQLADGRVKHVREQGETEFAADGAPLRTVGTLQDVTEQVLAEQEIRALNESLEQRVAERTEELARANRELESFSYSVSHDLRAPLRAINGFSRILQDSEEFALSESSRDLLERIVRNTNRMGDLIDDILEYSRASQAALNRKEVDLTALAQATWDEQAVSHPAAKVAIGRLGSVWGDAAMLRQVFDNLIGNALKYSGKREQPQVEVGASETPDSVTVFVRDNGAGFDMQYATKLFGMFQRMHTERDFPGTGVGLAIVKRIVERHGGRVWAEAAPDAGATFWFSLAKRR